MSNETDIFDLRQVTCGLVPDMSRKLESATASEVEFHLRQGIKLEIVSSFGTDSTWKLDYENHIGMDVARFTRRAPQSPADALNIVDY